MAQPPRGNPGSGPDWARELYDNTINQDSMNEAELAHMRSHPERAESMLPIWGPTREAIADLHDRDYLGAAGNTALAIADGPIVTTIARAALMQAAKTASNLAAPAAVKAAMKKASKTGMRGKAPYSWSNTRDRMLARGAVKPHQEVHHAFIPQRTKSVPDLIRNHPLNLKVMPEGPEGRTIHALIHHGLGKKNTPQRLERFNPLQRYIYGTPTWWKAANLAAGHGAGTAKAEWDKSK